MCSHPALKSSRGANALQFLHFLPQSRQGNVLDLPDALARHPESYAHFLKSPLLVAVQPESVAENFRLACWKRGHQLAHQLDIGLAFKLFVRSVGALVPHDVR